MFRPATGNPEKNQAILKISPGKQGSNAAYNYVEELEKKNGSWTHECHRMSSMHR
ncbi:hypothetical protein [Streptomyces sp. NPDC060035]|uniref:hypothetical protein n=1 Tax=Streptomyces sp. NPDC060035 TaxID=3347044 RepID=UPI0036A8F0EF